MEVFRRISRMSRKPAAGLIPKNQLTIKEAAMGRLTGRTTIVTGGGGGLGSASARRFAEEGAQVVVADVLLDRAEEVAKGIRETGGDAIALHLDLAEPESIKS